MPRCTAHNNRGDRCGRAAVAGATVCQTHGAKSPVVKAKAAVRAEVMRWGLGDTTIDPGEVLLRLLTQSAARSDRYAQEVERLVAAAPTLEEALVGRAEGEFGAIGEYIRGMAQLEAEERDRCAGFAVKAVAAGLAERQVRLAERQGQLLADVIRKVLDDPDLGLSREQRQM